MFRGLLKDVQGNIAITFGLLAPVAVLSVGIAIDSLALTDQRTKLQASADAAAIAVVREAPMHGWHRGKLREIARTYLDANILSSGGGNASYSESVVVNEAAGQVTVDVTQDSRSYILAGLLDRKSQMTVSATATLFGGGSTCLHALEGAAASALSLIDASSVRGDGCTILSNSTSASGIEVSSSADIVAEFICSAGGFTRPNSSYTPVPTTDCPHVPDPLVNRAIVDTGSCVETDYVIDGGSATLSPGTYCGTTEIRGGARVALAPGVYTFEGGHLWVYGGSELAGYHVTLQFAGTDSGFRFEYDTALSLSARSVGPTSGMLIHADAQSSDSRPFHIMSGEAERMIGVIYAPSGKLIIGGDTDLDGTCDPGGVATRNEDGDDDDYDDDDDDDHNYANDGDLANRPNNSAVCSTSVGQASDWTAIVANTIAFTLGANVQLNTDFATSEIPVPPGVTGQARLER